MDVLKKNKAQILSVLFLVFLGFMLLYSMSSLWLQRVVYAPETFSTLTLNALQQESSRQSIAGAITDKVFEDRPAAAVVVGPSFTRVLTGVLATDAAASIVELTASQVREVLISETTDVVSINTLPIKDSLSTIKVLAESGVGEQYQIRELPDEIVLVDLSSVKSFYDIGSYFVWVGLVTFVGSIGGMVWWVYRSRKDSWRKALSQISVVCMVVGVFALAIGPVTKPALLSLASSAKAETVLGNVYATLLQPFNEVAVVVFLIGFALLISSIDLKSYITINSTKNKPTRRKTKKK